MHAIIFFPIVHGRFRGVNVDSTFAIDFLFGEGVVFTVELSPVGTLKRLDQLLEIDVLECRLSPINGSNLPFEDELWLPTWLFDTWCELLTCLTSDRGENVEHLSTRKGSFSSWPSEANVCNVADSSGSGHCGVMFLMKSVSRFLFEDVNPPLSTSNGIIRSWYAPRSNPLKSVLPTYGSLSDLTRHLHNR